jgi:hypothetical protein
MLDVEATVRHEVYAVALARGAPPTIAHLSAALATAAPVVRSALQRLADARVLVLQPESGEILMVPPFSAVPTPFLVGTSRHSSYANCAWDALGVPVMLRQQATVVTACACCGEAITLDVSLDRLPEATAVIHFAVPAARWWHDIVFT